MVNKIFAVKRLTNFKEKEYKWWSVIDCGETKVGGLGIDMSIDEVKALVM